MKISKDFMLREICGSYIVVPFGENTLSFNAMITLNETGAFLWNKFLDEKTEEEAIMELLEEYNIDYETAKTDIDKFINKLKASGIIEP